MRIIALVVLLAVTYAPTSPAYAIACSNCSTVALQAKEMAMQAKSYALEVKGWMDTANTYIVAAQNTARIPLSALAKVQGTYYRVASLGNQVSALTSPNSTMMQRLGNARAIGRNAGGLPGSVGSSWEYWGEQTQRQLDDNAELLGLEEERRAINDELMELASTNGDTANGQLQALQANNQATIAVAQQLQALNDAQQRAFIYQMEKDAQAAAIQADRQKFLNDKPVVASPWLR